MRLRRPRSAQAARVLHLTTVRAEATRLADIALRERQTHLRYLSEVLAAEVDERTEQRQARRILEAKFPRLKRLSEFNFDAIPSIPAALLGQQMMKFRARGSFSSSLGDHRDPGSASGSPCPPRSR
jgi:DNA replication protein DnaC